MSIKVPELRKYITSGFNILLQGKHGTGKTSMLMEACQKEGLTFKQYNTASMDPFTDLVGVPKFTQDEKGNDYLVSVRPREIDEAEVVFFDELNRADPKITNAIFELIQFRTINGVLLPKLKCIVAAQNPPTDEYDVMPLDPALVDRFDIVLDVEPVVSVSYLSTKFDRKVALALKEWHDGHNKKRTDYISPRRLEILGNVFMKAGTKRALSAAMPPGGTFDSNKLFEMLSISTLSDEEASEKEKKNKEAMERLAGKRSGKNKNTRSHVRKVAAVEQAMRKVNYLGEPIPDFSAIRRSGPQAVLEVLKYNNLTKDERDIIVRAIGSYISINDMTGAWADVFAELTIPEVHDMNGRWKYNKRIAVNRHLSNITEYEKKKLNNFNSKNTFI